MRDQPGNLLLLALTAVGLILVSACGSEPGAPEEADMGDPLASSQMALSGESSVTLWMEVAGDYLGFADTTYIELRADGGGLSYSRTWTEGPPRGQFSDQLFIQGELFLKARDGQWYIASPADLPPEAERGFVFVDVDEFYEGLLGPLQDFTQVDSDQIDGETFLRYEAVEPEGTATLWLYPGSHLPRRVDISATSEFGAFDAIVEFSGYDTPVLLPDPPAGVLPLRDHGVGASVRCVRTAVADCLLAQDELSAASTPDCTGEGERLCIIPFGQVEADRITHLAAFYRDRYSIPVLIAQPRAIHEEYLNEKRGQVATDRLLEDIERMAEASLVGPSVTYIGITPIDVYMETEDYAWVFGSRRITGQRHGVISTFRMQPDFYGEPQNEDLLRARLRKMASKYVGMLYFDLPETSDPQSPLYNSIVSLPALDRVNETPLTPLSQ